MGIGIDRHICGLNRHSGSGQSAGNPHHSGVSAKRRMARLEGLELSTPRIYAHLCTVNQQLRGTSAHKCANVATDDRHGGNAEGIWLNPSAVES